MSRLTINNSNNNLGPITIDNSQCMFTLTTPSCFINNSTVIYNNSNGLNHTKISYDNGITVETSSNKKILMVLEILLNLRVIAALLRLM